MCPLVIGNRAVAFVVFCALALLLVAGLSLQPLWLQYRRTRIGARAFPAPWRKILQHRVPLVRRLPVDLQLQLKKLMHGILLNLFPMVWKLLLAKEG